jgi:uncharacterized membrane protein
MKRGTPFGLELLMAAEVIGTGRGLDLSESLAALGPVVLI